MSTTQPPASGPEFWQPQIRTWQPSGLSAAQFCQRHQLTYHPFLYWRQRLSGTAAASTALIGFAQVQLQAQADAPGGLSFALPTGFTLHGITAANLPVALQR